MLLSVAPSRNPKRKFTAVFADGTSVDFGAAGYGDYTVYSKVCGSACAAAHRWRYIARHRVNEDWTDPKARGTLARYLLWEFPNLDARAIAAYNDRFFT